MPFLWTLKTHYRPWIKSFFKSCYNSLKHKRFFACIILKIFFFLETLSKTLLINSLVFNVKGKCKDF